MTDTIAPMVPAGWYDDPWDPSSLRWWSGAEWTAHTSPKQAPPAPPAAEQVPYTLSRDPFAQGRVATVSEAVALTPKGSPQTPGIWLLAFLPLMNFGLTLLSTALLAFSGVPALGYVGVPVAIGLAVLFAVLDARALERRGYRRSSLLWLLVFPPLAYLIARGRSVRTEGGRAWPAELVYLANVALVIALYTFMAIGQYAAGNGAAADGGADDTGTHAGETYFAGTVVDEVRPEAHGIEYLIARTIDPAGSVIVDCTETALVMDYGAPFRCTATDPTGVRALIEGEITADGEVYFRYGILPDADEVHGIGNGVVVPQQNTAGSIGDERLPWQSQIEDGLATWGGYHGPGGVDCTEAAPVIDHSSTFDCLAWKSADEVVRLNVTITEIGNIEYTEYPLDPAEASQSV